MALTAEDGAGTGPHARRAQAIRHALAVFSTSRDDDTRGAAAGVLNAKSLVLNALLRTAESVASMQSSTMDRLDESFRYVDSLERASNALAGMQLVRTHAREMDSASAGLAIERYGSATNGLSGAVAGRTAAASRQLLRRESASAAGTGLPESLSSHPSAIRGVFANLAASAAGGGGRYAPMQRNVPGGEEVASAAEFASSIAATINAVSTDDMDFGSSATAMEYSHVEPPTLPAQGPNADQGRSETGTDLGETDAERASTLGSSI